LSQKPVLQPGKFGSEKSMPVPAGGATIYGSKSKGLDLILDCLGGDMPNSQWLYLATRWSVVVVDDDGLELC
jgi:hypothetical protein